MKNIAIIGSSGGNLYNLGGKEPHKLLNEIIQQANSAGINVADIVFVGADMSMDKVNSTTQARLITFDNEMVTGNYEILKTTNEKAMKADQQLAQKIINNEIDGIVVMSADPSSINKASLEAAAEKNIPIVGTGGTSMAKIQNIGANILAVSGTTGTTNRTRAISAISSLSKAFGLKYKPVIGSSGSSSTEESGNLKDRISVRGIMMASLPGFIAMSLVLALSKVSFLSEFGEIFNLLINVLPVIVAAIAAKQVSGLDEIGIVSGIVAGALSVQGGIIGGIIGGILAGLLASYMIRKAFDWKIPGTTANLIGGGLAGLIAGLFVYFLIAPIALAGGNAIRDLIEGALALSPALAGLVAGALIWPAILGGVYHAAILPIVLLEMESTGMSFLGAVDMVGLVMVSAGITLANILSPRRKENRSLAIPGFLINIGFGTFVEAAYPFMFSSKYVMGTAILSAAIGGLLVGVLGVFGTAYVPSVIAPGLSNNALGFVIAMLVAMFLSMGLTIISNRFTKEKVND
ncbi:PTS sugar transporter [Proteiniclasticum aestuarii]|nr:PTS sugar transporter [Proteiniclasticum aestuarii]